MDLTIQEIKKDIKEFEQRIQTARNRLAVLPETATTLNGKKKLKGKRYILTSEIKHVNWPISITRESLTDV